MTSTTTPLHQRLWAGQQRCARACLEHPFVRAIADGSADPAIFRSYVAQDAFFLNAFARGYALVAARAPDTATLTGAHALIGGVLEELDTHHAYATSLDIDLEAVVATPATLAYTDFLEALAWRGPLAVTLAAMVPCMRLYAYLGQQIAASGAVGERYALWVNTYAADDFEGLAQALESMLDAHADASLTRELEAAYARAMQLEFGFFDSCWREAGSAR